MRMSMKLRIGLFVAAACGVLATPTLARAQAGDTVSACVQKSSKAARIVAVGVPPSAGACTNAETLVQWNIQGPAGTNGTSVTVTGTFEGSLGGCPNGGVTLLDGATSTTYYLCDGKDGTDGSATMRADGPCYGNSPDGSQRYFDCGNGTVTDTVTGLVWLKQADCFDGTTWAAANQTALGLKAGDCGLTDHSSAGDWRLPTKDEWSATVAQAVALGCGGAPPTLTDDAGTGCMETGAGSSFTGAGRGHYWSSSTNEGAPSTAWSVRLLNGQVSSWSKVTYILYVWPVRSGR